MCVRGFVFDKLIKTGKPEKLEKPEKPDNAMKPTSVGFMRLSGSAIKPILFDNKCKTM